MFEYNHMTSLDQNQTVAQLQMVQVRDNSPEELNKDGSEPLPAVNNSWNFNIKRCMFLIFMFISSSILLSQINAQSPNLPVIKPEKSFQFYVYCPYYYKDKLKPLKKAASDNEELRRRVLYSTYSNEVRLKVDDPTYDLKNMYVVEMQSTKNEEGKNALYYCGFVTNYLTTCDEAVQYKCSSPGPMFDLKVHQSTDIVWINNLDPNYYPEDPSSCIGKTNSSHCTLLAKPSGNVKMTYVDPTNKNDTHVETSPIVIANTAWPASTHVHGAEVRPTFDGNPLSWFDNVGNRGVGAFSLSDSCYYDSFDQNDDKNNDYMPPEIVVRNIQKDLVLPQSKISRYPNIQNPGNLWYHDHAMRLTLYNVQYGLAGNFILRDDAVTNEIGVHRSNQKLYMMTVKGLKAEQLELSSETVYRFRFLNNNYGRESVFNIFFANGVCETQRKVPFTIIGADSSLFKEGIYDQTQFTIAQAERIEILIKFPASVQKYSICDSLNSANNIENIQVTPKTQQLNNRTTINPVKLPVSFVDFADKANLVAVKRMRPLMSLSAAGSTIFMINGRASFHEGRSQNPVIGTYQDWYLINTMGGGHPIHIHLINYQVIKTLSLRNISNSCTLYELDFYAQAIFPKYAAQYPKIFLDKNNPKHINYTELCIQKSAIQSLSDITKLLSNVNLEDQIDPTTKISGINVEKQLDAFDRALFKELKIEIPEDQHYKYYTKENPVNKPFYKKWKDTAYVQKYEVSVFRIRWARSSYEDASNDPNYFHVPVDQLREYPGFVYHCHILGHQDNEMMRPIMLQLPKNPNLDTSTPCNQGPDFSWEAKVKCINEVQCAGKK